MAMFRDEPHHVLELLDEAERADGHLTWPVAFMRGTAHLLAGDDERAMEALRTAEALQPTPEGTNNLGVALARAGRVDDSREAFAQGLARCPDYEDARINLAAEAPVRVTTHPLRGWDADTP